MYTRETYLHSCLTLREPTAARRLRQNPREFCCSRLTDGQSNSFAIELGFTHNLHLIDPISANTLNGQFQLAVQPRWQVCVYWKTLQYTVLVHCMGSNNNKWPLFV